MKEALKTILKNFQLYHPLQLFYRQTVFSIRKIYLRHVYRKYKGDGFTCNVCGGRYTRFVPVYPSHNNRRAIENNQVIAGYGENVLCPYCLSTARERLVIAVLGKMNLQGKKILHLSPEKNVFLFLTGKAEVITADLAPGFYKNIDKHILQADATKLSFPDNRFDIVIGNHILEHIPDDLAAMREIFRVLKPGGTAVLQVPFSITIAATLEDPFINHPEKQAQLFGQKDHVRIYHLSDYISRLKQTGFSVEYIRHESLQEFHQFAIQPGEGFLKITK